MRVVGDGINRLILLLISLDILIMCMGEGPSRKRVAFKLDDEESLMKGIYTSVKAVLRETDRGYEL